MLTKEQIDFLFKFCEKHYVYFYDLQLELVDHLAGAIEEEMSRDKKLSFEKALHTVYSRFGIMGFSGVVRERGRQLEKQSRREYWQVFKAQFYWPQILKSLFAGALFYTLFSWNEVAGLIMLGVLVLTGSITNIMYGVRLSREVKKTGKKFMLMQYAYQFNFGWLSLQVFSQALARSHAINPLTYGIAMALYFALFTASNQLSKTVGARLRNEFPEVFQTAKS